MKLVERKQRESQRLNYEGQVREYCTATRQLGQQARQRAFALSDTRKRAVGEELLWMYDVPSRV